MGPRNGRICTLLVGAVLIAGCSYDGPERATTATAIGAGDGETTETSAEPPVETGGPPPSAGAGDTEPVTVRHVDTDALRGAGEHGTISHLGRFGRRQIAVGDVQNADRDRHRPLVMEAVATGEWVSSEVELPSGATDATAVSTVRGADGSGPVVFGTEWGRSGADGAAWRRRQDRWVPIELSGAIVDDGDQVVDKVARGGSGWLAIGSDDGAAAVWSSADGRDWDVARTDVAADDVRFVDAAVDGDDMMVVARTVDRSLVLRSGDTETFTTFREASRDVTNFTAVLSTREGFAIGGGQTIDGQFSPHVWRVSGDIWPFAAVAIPYEGVQTNAGVTVDAMVTDRDDRLYATAAGSVVRVAESGAVDPVTSSGPDGTRALDVLAPGRGADVIEGVAGGRAVWALSGERPGGRWTDATPDALPTAERTVSLAGVAVSGGTWAAAGTIERGDDRRTVVWSSGNGSSWEPARDLPRADDTSALTLGASDDGFVLIGQDADRVALWVSPDAADWTRIESPVLEYPDDGYLQPESILATSSGFAVAGFHFTGTAIHPWMLERRSGDLQRVDLPTVRGARDSVTLDLCGNGRRSTVVGAWQRYQYGPAWWSLADGTWESHSQSGPVWSLDTCAWIGGRLLAVGTAGTVLELDERWQQVGVLPDGSGTSELNMDVLGDIVVVTGDRGEGRGPGLWISHGVDAGEWTDVGWGMTAGADTLGSVVGTTGHDDELIVAIDEGVSGRLLRVRTR